MPRRARISLAGVPHHIIQRGNNRDACFYSDQDYLFYLQWLKAYAALAGCSIHAYVLMANHVHLLVTPQTKEGVGLLMRRLGQRYVQYISRTYQRSGTLWEGWYKSCAVKTESCLLTCYRYIDLNSVRAGMIGDPSEYIWSSYRCNGLGIKSPL